jgi:hypothetical protein
MRARGVFLSGAIRPVSSVRWPLHRVGGLGAPASANSAQAVPQQGPHADHAVTDAELLADDVANAFERPQLGGVSGGSGAAE